MISSSSSSHHSLDSDIEMRELAAAPGAPAPAAAGARAGAPAPLNRAAAREAAQLDLPSIDAQDVMERADDADGIATGTGTGSRIKDFFHRIGSNIKAAHKKHPTKMTVLWIGLGLIAVALIVGRITNWDFSKAADWFQNVSGWFENLYKGALVIVAPLVLACAIFGARDISDTPFGEKALLLLEVGGAAAAVAGASAGAYVASQKAIKA